jgi:hypothetical protein
MKDASRYPSFKFESLSIHTDVITHPAYPGGRPGFASGVESLSTQVPSGSGVWHSQTKK